MTTSNSQEFTALFTCSKWQIAVDYISYNGNKCQLMMLLPNQFNKRPDFWIISITWLWLFPNLILCSFDIFDKRVFSFVVIKSIVFFFLATILIMAMFNFQFWFRIKIGDWYYLTCCTSLLNSHFLVCCFKTVELHVVQLIVKLFTALTDLILQYFNLLYHWSHWTKYIFFSYIITIC